MSSVERTARAERRRSEEEYRKHQRLCWDCYRQAPSPGCDTGRELHGYMEMFRAQEHLLLAQDSEQADATQKPLF